MAAGNVTAVDQVNQILLSAGADLVCLGRAHLSDPYWTLRAAANLGDAGTEWPKPYLAARAQALGL
jgi:anthraniloyl-CoA monooxygenase